jgi:acetoin utilization protein AcuB
MQVKEWMTTVPVTVAPDAAVTVARDLLRQKGIRHLPVCEYDKLVGIVTDRDIRMALPSPATSLSVWEIGFLLDKLTVDAVMTRAVITVCPDAAVEEAVQLILATRVGALPVTQDGHLIGIITETDLLRAFSVMLGEPAEIPATALGEPAAVRATAPTRLGDSEYFELYR